MKKVFALLVCVCLVLSMFGTSMVFAADAATVSIEVAESCAPGDQVTVTVKLSNAANYCGVSFGLIYDNTKLSVVSAAKGEIANIGYSSININKSENQVYFNVAGSDPVSVNGTIMTVVFNVLETASGKANFSIYDLKVYDESSSLMTSKGNVAELDIARPLPLGKTYITETAYVTGSTTKVQVTTTVTGLSSNEQVAYMVTSNNTGDIVWVDQKAASDGIATFEFKTSAVNAQGLGSTIMVGSEGTTAGEFEDTKQDLIKLQDFTASWSVNGTGGRVYAAETIATSGSVSGNSVTFVVMPDAGYVLSGLTKNGEEVISIGAQDHARIFELTGNTEFVFTFSAVNAATPVINYTGTALNVVEENNIKTVSIPAKAANATEFGILVGESANTLDVAAIADLRYDVSTNGVAKFKALGANEDGTFIISLGDEKVDGVYKVFNGTNEFTGVAYAINGSNVVFSDTFTFGR